jgi:hypothetical protein
MIMQAIQTKYIPATNTKGARVKAWAWAGSLTIAFASGVSTELNHVRAARALAVKLNWTKGEYGALYGGCLPNGREYAFVFAHPTQGLYCFAPDKVA